MWAAVQSCEIAITSYWCEIIRGVSLETGLYSDHSSKLTVPNSQCTWQLFTWFVSNWSIKFRQEHLWTSILLRATRHTGESLHTELIIDDRNWRKLAQTHFNRYYNYKQLKLIYLLPKIESMAWDESIYHWTGDCLKGLLCRVRPNLMFGSNCGIKLNKDLIGVQKDKCWVRPINRPRYDMQQ